MESESRRVDVGVATGYGVRRQSEPGSPARQPRWGGRSGDGALDERLGDFTLINQSGVALRLPPHCYVNVQSN